MKKFFCLLFALTLTLPLVLPWQTVFAAPSPPPATGVDSYVVMNAQTGQVLIQKNMNKKEYPASITKIMTSMLGFLHGKPTDRSIVTEEAVFSIDRGSTHIALTHGEEVTLEQMQYATMLMSANDASNVIAEQIGGSLAAFADMMNEKAWEVGAQNTHFSNAHGLPDPKHYTTAYDMALITQAALEVPGFREVFGALEYSMNPTNKQSQSRLFGTYHHMLVNSPYFYPASTGGKLGWTPEANHTIVTVAQKNGVELICVGMNTTSKWGKYIDSIALLDYCFNNFVPAVLPPDQQSTFEIPVVDEGKYSYNAVLSLPADASPLLIHRDLAIEGLQAEYKLPSQFDGRDNISAAAKIHIDGEGLMFDELGNIPLSYELVPTLPPPDGGNSFPQKIFSSLSLWGFIKGAFIVFVVLVILLLIIRQINLYRYRKRRARMAARHPESRYPYTRHPRNGG